MRLKYPLPRQKMAGVVYRKKNSNSVVVAHSKGPGHIFKFTEVEILARGDNRMSRELLESWFTGPQFINKRNDFAFGYCVLINCLSKRISLVGRAGPSNNSDDSEHNFRAITKPASNTDKEILVINKSNAECQDITAPIKTPLGDYRRWTDIYSMQVDDRHEL
ncbi:unnamed protein product [Dibothriocephalus latus]|uniref:Uncharacterized protein n=1 Tax=Dibothriocephalus latus TaxID=60516 RepID=A0A3P6SI75_DIBLA|nr:unnamed protein product [Dibothriocephalus latus]